MKIEMKKLKNLIIGDELEFRVRLFNVMAVGGAFMSFLTTIQSIITGMWETAGIAFIMMCLSIFLLYYAVKSGQYQRCYKITIFSIFFLFFPILFFSAGGYNSGVPAAFIFAVLFTVLMLEGKNALIISMLELLTYAGICIVAYLYPGIVNEYTSEKEIMIDIIFSYTAIGMICGIVLYFHIKEYSLQRKLLEEQNEKLKSYDDAKTTFLTTVAHEIKNPLNIIGLYSQDTSELAREQEVDVEQICENQRVIGNTVTRLDRIVADLMDTVSIEQGRLKLTLAPMDMSELILETVEFWKEKEGEGNLNGNRIVLNLSTKKTTIMADYTRIFQVMVNLISNAHRHTKNGIITITLKNVGNGQLVSIRDTGEGMPDQLKQKVFKGYVSTNKDYWRHGIGLYICYQIIEAHGGKIWIESQLGKGTEISFLLREKRSSKDQSVKGECTI